MATTSPHNEEAISSIECRVTFRDGRTCNALILPDGVQRWGADRRTLAATVPATKAMHLAAASVGAFGEEE